VPPGAAWRSGVDLLVGWHSLARVTVRRLVRRGVFGRPGGHEEVNWSLAELVPGAPHRGSAAVMAQDEDWTRAELSAMLRAFEDIPSGLWLVGTDPPQAWDGQSRAKDYLRHNTRWWVLREVPVEPGVLLVVVDMRDGYANLRGRQVSAVLLGRLVRAYIANGRAGRYREIRLVAAGLASRKVGTRPYGEVFAEAAGLPTWLT